MKTKYKKKKFAAFLHPKYLAVGVLAISLLTTSLAFATSIYSLPEVKTPIFLDGKSGASKEKSFVFTQDQMKFFVKSTIWIESRVQTIAYKYDSKKLKDLRAKALPIQESLIAYCRDGHLECAVELKNVDSGVKGATKDALIRILKENWKSIKTKGQDMQKNATIVGE